MIYIAGIFELKSSLQNIYSGIPTKVHYPAYFIRSRLFADFKSKVWVDVQTKYASAVPKFREREWIFARAVKVISSSGVCSPCLRWKKYQSGKT